jgi:hypothetical protein
MIIFAALTIVWFLLAIIPTRFLVMAVGIGQYVATFLVAVKRFIGKVDDAKDPQSLSIPLKDPRPHPIVTSALNFFRGLPTDEDLRRAYFWESCRAGEMERNKLATAKRATRVQRLWKAQWHGHLEIKEKGDAHSGIQTMDTSRDWSWEHIFAIIQGHQFIWWRGEKEFDDGESPIGRIFFAGHAGLAGSSPLEMRELKREEIPFVVNIFGRGKGNQMKISLLAANETVRSGLEGAVLKASEDTKDD